MSEIFQNIQLLIPSVQPCFGRLLLPITMLVKAR